MGQLHVELVAADRKVWEGEAKQVSARTVEGELGILPGHTPLLGILVNRARRIQRFLSQNTYVAKQFTGLEGSTVSLAESIEGFTKIADGEFDHVAEQAFYMCGGLDDVERQWSEIQKNL